MPSVFTKLGGSRSENFLLKILILLKLLLQENSKFEMESSCQQPAPELSFNVLPCRKYFLLFIAVL